MPARSGGMENVRNAVGRRPCAYVGRTAAAVCKGKGMQDDNASARKISPMKQTTPRLHTRPYACGGQWGGGGNVRCMVARGGGGVRDRYHGTRRNNGSMGCRCAGGGHAPPWWGTRRGLSLAAACAISPVQVHTMPCQAITPLLSEGEVCRQGRTRNKIQGHSKEDRVR